MPETKFTPGPWRMMPKTLGTIEAENGKVVAQTFDIVSALKDPTHFERFANAHLIAAAPCLYAALEGMLAIEDSVTQRQERELRKKWIAEARDALAKARGES